MKKLLSECGVYELPGCLIPQHKELSLDENKVYKILKDSDFILSMAKSAIESKQVALFNKSPFNSDPIGLASNFSHIDGLLFCELSVDDNGLDISAAYTVETIIKSGEYLGVSYDLVFKNPKLNSVSLVDRSLKKVV